MADNNGTSMKQVGKLTLGQQSASAKKTTLPASPAAKCPANKTCMTPLSGGGLPDSGKGPVFKFPEQSSTFKQSSTGSKLCCPAKPMK